MRGQFCGHNAWGYRVIGAGCGGYDVFSSWPQGIRAEAALLEHYRGLPWSYADAVRYCACASPARWQRTVEEYVTAVT